MLLVIMHNDEDYLKKILSTFKEKKAIAEARIIKEKGLALSIGQADYIFGGALPAPLSGEYDCALAMVVKEKKEADSLIKILESNLETITLSDKGLVVTLPLNCIENLVGRMKNKSGSKERQV